MTLPIFLSFFWRRISLPVRQPPSNPEKDFMELSIMQAHDERAMQYLRDARDIAAFEARMQSLQSERNWW
ncbi:MAG TPA: hypothetical protein VF445_14495 [Bordetella sp.]|uniref:hypothetical protein n=1 Tax=Bordetella sp. TaxID=28081 RepID=UPI002ED516D4